MPDEFCPICDSKIKTGYVNKESFQPGPDDPIPCWTEDPIKTSLGLAGTTYKGEFPVRRIHVVELQEYYKSVETQLSISPTDFIDIDDITIPKYEAVIEQLRISVEQILVVLGLTLIDYFKYDRYGNITVRNQSEWTDCDRSSGNPRVPEGTPIRALHIEELRRGVYAITAWIETWSQHIIARQSNPPVSPSYKDRYIVLPTGSGDWVGKDNYIAEWNGISWVFTTPLIDSYGNYTDVYVKGESKFYKYNGSAWIWAESDKYLEVLYSSGYLEDSIDASLYSDHNWTYYSFDSHNIEAQLHYFSTPQPPDPNWWTKVEVKREILSDNIYKFYSNIDISSIAGLGLCKARGIYIPTYSGEIESNIYSLMDIKIESNLKIKTEGPVIVMLRTFTGPPAWYYAFLLNTRLSVTIWDGIFTYPVYYVYSYPGEGRSYATHSNFLNWVPMDRDFYTDCDNMLHYYGRNITDANWRIHHINIYYENLQEVYDAGRVTSELNLQMDTIKFYRG